MHITEGYGIERRKFERKIFYSPAYLILPERKPLKVRTFDISADGLGVVSSENIPPKLNCVVQFTLPTLKNYELRARTVHTIFKSGEGFKVGLQFVNPPPALLMEIVKYIKS